MHKVVILPSQAFVSLHPSFNASYLSVGSLLKERNVTRRKYIHRKKSEHTVLCDRGKSPHTTWSRYITAKVSATYSSNEDALTRHVPSRPRQGEIRGAYHVTGKPRNSRIKHNNLVFRLRYVIKFSRSFWFFRKY